MRVNETIGVNMSNDGVNADRLGQNLTKEIERSNKQVFREVLRQIKEN